MSLPSRTDPLDHFAQRKATFDEQLQHLQLLSQHNFGLEENTIQHAHCGELLYYSFLLEDIINSIVNRPSQTTQE